MWEKLGKLATKRNTTITALLVEGAEYILDAGGYSKPTPPSTEETLTRLATLEKEFQTLSLQVNESGGHVRVQAVPPTEETLTDLSQRLDQIEKAIAPLIQALKKIPHVELVMAKPTDVKDADFETSTPTLPPDLKPPLSQRELSDRLGQRYSYYLQKHRAKGKEHFEAWSQSVDPDGIAWTFDEPKRHRGKTSTKTLKFYPKP
jgi:hypothetical protein